MGVKALFISHSNLLGASMETILMVIVIIFSPIDLHCDLNTSVQVNLIERTFSFL